MLINYYYDERIAKAVGFNFAPNCLQPQRVVLFGIKAINPKLTDRGKSLYWYR